MRFGMFDQIEDPGGVELHRMYRDRLDLAVRAEDAGFWGYHKSEHHMIPLDAAPNISVFLAALSQRTTTMRLCSLVHLLPFHHPLALAEEVAMLDHLTEGRFEFGFGKGISAPEHHLWGLDPDEAEARLDESLDIVLSILGSPGEFSYEGRFWSFRDVPVQIRPLQPPYPPLWRPGTLSTAARLGVSTMVGGPIANVAAGVRAYHEQYQPGVGGGHEPTIGGIRRVFVARTDADAEARCRAAWRPYTEHLTRLFRRYEMTPPGDPTLGGDFDLALRVQACVAGSPAKVRDHVLQFREEAGTDYFVGCFAWGDLSGDEARRSFDLFAEQITDLV
jgi:alkanesulfonate monooxygenase SsuD/methylene tetrahydromethanopterin reductase-like flavin-dependent oxidoreductase (luciferase family)